jgi:plasmid stability protein
LTVPSDADKLLTYPGKTIENYMQDKQKVTLYLPPGLHRQLKIRAAVDSDSMSAMVERAIVFYLHHPEMIDEVEAAYGKTHQVYACPECSSPVALQGGEMVSLREQPGLIEDEELPLEKVREEVNSRTGSQGEEELAPC